MIPRLQLLQYAVNNYWYAEQSKLIKNGPKKGLKQNQLNKFYYFVFRLQKWLYTKYFDLDKYK